MLLTAKVLHEVCNVNSFSYPEDGHIEAYENNSISVYFQLWDCSVELCKSPKGRRYMPLANSTLEVTFTALNTDVVVVADATQPFAQDPSIWVVTLANDETPAGTRSMALALSEPADPLEDPIVTYNVTNGYLAQALVVKPLSPEF